MTPCTLVMAYYENYTMLSEQFANIAAFPDDYREKLHVVIVDDGSPNNPAKPFDFPVCGVSLQIYRMRKDVRWNQDACRNIGVSHAETEWVLLTDMDHVVPLQTWKMVLFRRHDPAKVYQFARVTGPEMTPYKMHPNTWLMTKKMFDKVGGYDERFAGFYGTDGDFSERVRTIARVEMFKEPVVRIPRTHIPDASTTTYLRKQPEDKPAIIRIKAERAKEKNWKPLRGTFEYDRVHPAEL